MIAATLENSRRIEDLQRALEALQERVRLLESNTHRRPRQAATRPGLSDKQVEMVRWIRGFCRDHGRCPKLIELADAFGYKNNQTASYHVEKMRKLGVLAANKGRNHSAIRAIWDPDAVTT